MSDTETRDQLVDQSLNVLCNAANFPRRAQPALLGQNMRPLAEAVADELIERGWRPPARVVTTVQELDALPVGAIIMEGDHGTPDDTGWGFKTMPGVFHRFPEGWHVVSGIGERAPDLPATVLYEPKEDE